MNELDDEAFDALPYGVVCLSEAGRVLRMNRAASEGSGIQPWRAVGRDYAREIAPVLKKRHADVVIFAPPRARRA